MTKEEGGSSMKQGRSSMMANSMKLISAGTFVQVLAFLLLPVIGRIYTESEIGQITVFLSVVGVLTIVATGRYDQATILARSKERALLLLFTALRFNLIFCLALIPAGVISLLSWANSHNQYGRMSIAQISQGLGNNLLRIGFGLLKMGFWGLQLAALLGGMAGIFPLVRKQALLSQYKRYVTRRRLRIAARTYANFPRYSLPQAVIDILSGSLVSLLLPLQYHDAAIGLYGMAYMLAGRPMQLISDSLSRVWFRRVAEQKNTRQSFLLPIRRFVFIWLLVAVLGSILIFFFLEPLVVVILGKKWLLCSSIIMAMLPFFIFNFLSSVYNFLPDLFGKQQKFMRMQAILLIVQLLVILIGTRLLPFEKYMWLHFAERALDSLVQIAWFYMIIRKYENSLRLHSCAS
uniref:PorS protein n=1 Tax=Porphyromonas gingivalis TaxID=837 RepID=O86166_PORGN|nr:PorS [Porphyromonas gingivalis] [Porphyromonas gingivalis ATCC 33277]